MSTIREDSKKSWTSNNSIEDINGGSLQRIADSLERIEKPYLKLLNDVEYYKKMANRRLMRIETLERSRNTYKGLYNKLKKLNSD